MKKLIAMIGAVATAFGLYAAAPASFATPYSISFEASEPGAGDGSVFDLSDEAVSGWDWTSTDALNLGAYAGDAYLYPIEGAAARRTDLFTDGDVQSKFLKLETGTNVLTRSVGDGNVFLDQLVKFTGFEEPQTNVVAGTKIAVWMSGIEEDEDTVGETNLYVTCGKVAADKTVEPVALKIAAPGNQAWETEKWYRLTIKSIDDIYGGVGASDAARAGFIVYIDGTPVASSDAAAKALVAEDFISEMTTQAKGLMMNGQLFPAIDTTDAVFASVGYQGIGAVDDIILDNEGPAFCAALNFNVAPALGLKIVKVETEAGEIFAPYAVVSGTGVTITFGAADGYKVLSGSDKLVVDATISTEGQTVGSPAEGIETAEVVAQIIRDEEVAAEFAEVELDTAFGYVEDGDQIKFVKGCSAFEGAYAFPIDTTIDVTAGGNWDIKVPGEWASLTDKIGAAPEKQITVTFTDDAEYSSFFLAGNIYGNGRVDTLVDVNGYTVLDGNLTIGDTFQAEDGAGAVLQSDHILGYVGDGSDGSYAITLVGKGKVVTQDPLPETAFTTPAAGFEIEETTEEVEETTWYTYALKGADVTATFVIPGEDEVTTVDVQTVAYGSAPTNVVVEIEGFTGWDPAIGEIIADTLYTAQFSVEPAIEYVTFTVAADESIASVTVKTNGEDVVAVQEGTYTVESNAVVTITAEMAEDYENLTITSDDVEITEGVFTASVADAEITIAATAIPYVASVTADGVLNKYKTVAEALAAVQENEGIAEMIVVTCLAADGLKIEVGDESVSLAKGETITITADNWAFDQFAGNVVLQPGKTIKAKSLAAGATITTIDGYEVVKSETADADGYFTYSVVQSVAVAKIGTTGYPTLAAAATAAVDNDTIVLLDDYTLSSDENVVFTNKVVTLDLGDNQLTIRGDNKSFVIATDSDVTLTNGVITGTASYGIKVDGTLTVDDIDMDANGAGPCFDMYANASITVNSGSFLNFHDVFRLTKVDNATPTVVVNGGTFSSTQYGAFYAYKAGCAADITINDGTFETRFIYGSAAATGFVWAGDKLDDTCKAKFKVISKHETSTIDLADFIADGYTLVKGEDEYYMIEALPPVANVTIGGETTPYTDLHAALVAGSVAGAVVELVDNVDLTGINWEPVPNFLGKFDGKGKTISNLKIDVTGGGAGLFGDYAWGKNHNGICNLVISNADVKATGNNVGVLAAKNGSDGGCVISNVTVCGNIKVIGESYVGGLVGHNQYSHIIDCHVIGDGTATSVIGYGEVVDDVLKGSGQIGGLVGQLLGGSDDLIDGSLVGSVDGIGNEDT